MNKKSKVVFLLCSILLITITAVLVYILCFQKDVNGYTRKDITEAKQVVRQYINAANAQDRQTVYNCLSQKLIVAHGLEDEARKEQFLTSLTGTIFENAMIRYEGGSPRYRSEVKWLQDSYGVEADIIYLLTDFNGVIREDAQFIGSFENGKYENFGFYLIRRDEDWKIVDWGY